MGSILEYLFSSAAIWLWVLLAFALVAAAYAFHGRSFALTDFTYTFPLVGKLHRFSKDYAETYRGNGWLNVEDTLCRDYARHVSALSKAQFDNHMEYLRRAYDHGRKPLPMWALGTLTVLISMEGLGFSYLLGSLINPEASEYIRNWLMFGVVAVLATILVWVMHAAGHQLYRTNLLRNCFKEFQANKNPSFTSQVVTLSDDQTTVDATWPADTCWPNGQRVPADLPVPKHVQCANRVATNPADRGSYAWIWLAALLMVAIAIGSTVLRIEMRHAAEAAPSFAGMFQVGGSPQPAAQAPAPGSGAQEIAAMSGFAILGIIFVVTQLVGMSVGYRYGFAGKQSKEAYQATHGAPDYDTYWEPIQRRMNIANLRLHTLHRLLEKHSPRPIDFNKTFINFIEEERKRGADDLQMPPRSGDDDVRKGANGGSHPAGTGATEAAEAAAAEAAGATEAPNAEAGDIPADAGGTTATNAQAR